MLVVDVKFNPFAIEFAVDWESCDEEEAELDDTDKAKARR